jgi:hypothetical protein
VADVIGWVPRPPSNAVQRSPASTLVRSDVEDDCCCGCTSCPNPCDPLADFPAWYDVNVGAATISLPTGCMTDVAPDDDHTPDTANYGLKLLSAVASFNRTYRVCLYQQGTDHFDAGDVDYALYHCTLPLEYFFDFATYSDDTTCTTPTVPRLPLLLFPTLAVYYNGTTTSWDIDLAVRHPGWNLVSVFDVPPAAATQYVRPWTVVHQTAGSLAGPPNGGTIGGLASSGSIFATPCGLVTP